MKTTNYILPLAAFAAGALFAKSKSSSSIGAMNKTITVWHITARSPTSEIHTEAFSKQDAEEMYALYTEKYLNPDAHNLTVHERVKRNLAGDWKTYAEVTIRKSRKRIQE